MPAPGVLLVQMEGIEKTFPGVHALSQARFDLRPGEVHALVGENGAGKSTLMKVLAGVYHRDDGRVLVRGEQAEIPNPRAALDMGISMIHQELNLMPHLTVAQNIFIGREPRKGARFWLDEQKINAQTTQLFESMHLHLMLFQLISAEDDDLPRLFFVKQCLREFLAERTRPACDEHNLIFPVHDRSCYIRWPSVPSRSKERIETTPLTLIYNCCLRSQYGLCNNRSALPDHRGMFIT